MFLNFVQTSYYVYKYKYIALSHFSLQFLRPCYKVDRVQVSFHCCNIIAKNEILAVKSSTIILSLSKTSYFMCIDGVNVLTSRV